MISIAHCEKVLAQHSAHLSKQEVRQLRASLYQLASIFVKQYLSETKGQMKEK